jgi:2-alkyl-3-oxoalkanoate reductase
MKVLVTGASGFLGSHIAEQFAREGHRVRVLLRRTSSRAFLQDFPHEEALGDVTDPASLPGAVRGADTIVHAAGLIKARSHSEFDAVNRSGTVNLAEAALRHAPDIQRFIYISSLAAHGPSPDGKPRPHDAPPQPLTAYGRTKLGGEDVLRLSPLSQRSVMFRMPVIYGPRDPALLSFFKVAKMRIAPLLNGGRHKISIIYAEDAARAVVQSATAEANIGGNIYTPEDGGIHSWQDLLAAIEIAVGRRAFRIHSPVWLYSLAAVASEGFSAVTRRAVPLTREKVREMAQPYWLCASDDLRRDLGWKPEVNIHEGARRTADWYRQAGWL